MAFKKAERFLVNPTIAVTGPTGSGKTKSSLRLAAGIAKAMNGRFAVIDAENGSASLYSDEFDFDTLNLTPPFTTEKYIEAINLAEKGGYVALVCDSMTHAWAGEGGLLEQKSQLDARPNSNHWTNWNPIKAKDLKFKNTYLHSSIPFFIGTMRSKMEYAQSENNGKKKVEKVGMAPVQSDGIEYEFSLVFDVAMNHEAEVSKDRTGLFAKNKIFQITEETGEELVKWRNSGKAKPNGHVHNLPAGMTIDKDAVSKSSETLSTIEDAIQFFKEVDADDIDAALGNHPEGSAEAAALYKIEFGKFAGRELKSFSPEGLKSICAELEAIAHKQGKTIDPTGPVGKMLTNARIFLGLEP